MVNVSLGEYIRINRQRRNMTLSDVSDVTGISVAGLSKIERGKTKQPSREVLREIAFAINVPTDELLERAGYITEDTQEQLAELAAQLANAQQEILLRESVIKELARTQLQKPPGYFPANVTFEQALRTLLREKGGLDRDAFSDDDLDDITHEMVAAFNLIIKRKRHGIAHRGGE